MGLKRLLIVAAAQERISWASFVVRSLLLWRQAEVGTLEGERNCCL